MSEPYQSPAYPDEPYYEPEPKKKVNYYRLKAGSLGFRLPLRSSRLKDYAPKGGGFYHTPPSAV